MFQRLSLKTILIGGAILAAMIPALLVEIALVGSLYNSVIRAATERYELLAKGLASEYDQFLRSHRQAVRTLADHVEEYRAFGERSVAPLEGASSSPPRRSERMIGPLAPLCQGGGPLGNHGRPTSKTP